MARGLKFRIKKVEGLYYLCSKTKGADHPAVTARLICVFVFAYAKGRFFHHVAHLFYFNTQKAHGTYDPVLEGLDVGIIYAVLHGGVSQRTLAKTLDWAYTYSQV